MKNAKTPVSLLSLGLAVVIGSGTAGAQQYPPQPPYPPQPAPQYPPQYPPQPRPAQPAPQYPPQYPPQPAPQYPPQPPQPPRPPQPQYPAPQYPAPQAPPPPGYPPPAPYPPGPQQPMPPGYPPPAPGYPPQTPYADPNNPYGYAPQPAVGARMHDGFYLRLMLGPSFQHSSGKVSGVDVKTTLSGFGMLFDIAVGATVAENFVVYGTVTNHAAFNPEFKAKGPGGEQKRELDESVNFQGFGAGVAYYFQPHNVHAGGALHLARLTNDDDDSDVGLGLNVNVGKDWWVSDAWSIGVSGQIMAARINLDIKEPTQTFKNKLNCLAGAVAFTATFN